MIYGNKILGEVGCMEKLKNRFLNNITLYQLPVFSKIGFISSATGLTLLVMFSLIVLDEKTLAILLLIAFVLFDILMFFLVFKTYLRMDFNSKTFVIREFPGFKEINVDIEDIITIKVSKDYKYKTFTIDILCKTKTIIIKSWSTGFTGFHLMFNNNKRQINRLIKFCKECNEYLQNQKLG